MSLRLVASFARIIGEQLLNRQIISQSSHVDSSCVSTLSFSRVIAKSLPFSIASFYHFLHLSGSGGEAHEGEHHVRHIFGLNKISTFFARHRCGHGQGTDRRNFN